MRRLNAAAKDLVKELQRDGVRGISYVTHSYQFLHRESKKPLAHLYADDELHLSEAGAKVLRDSIKHAARELNGLIKNPLLAIILV